MNRYQKIRVSSLPVILRACEEIKFSDFLPVPFIFKTRPEML
jgi:hypothetical protein